MKMMKMKPVRAHSCGVCRCRCRCVRHAKHLLFHVRGCLGDGEGDGDSDNDEEGFGDDDDEESDEDDE